MKRRKSKKTRVILLSGIYSLIGILVLLIVLLAAAPSFMLNTLGFRTYVSHYDQMAPTIESNSLVFITQVDLMNIESNDLITFQSNTDLNDDGRNDLITGYFDRTNGTGDAADYYFRSEGSVGDWAVIQSGNIIGGYGFSIPILGLIIDFIGSPFGIAVVCVNIAIISGIVFIVKQGSKKEPKETQKEQ